MRATSREPAKNVTIIAIDEESLEKIGRWPWSREVLAKMTDQLAAAKAKVIANTILLSEPQVDPGYQYIVKLLDLAQKSAAQPRARRRAPSRRRDCHRQTRPRCRATGLLRSSRC